MALSEASRTRLIRWLKIALPLAAIALLSTLFLLSRNTDPMAEIPFSTLDLKESARTERITRPSFAGATEEGDMIALTAASALPRPAGRLDATDLSARLDTRDGGHFEVVAGQGMIDQPAETVTLGDAVHITTSTGYRIETAELLIGLRETRAESAGEIRGTGPAGRFTAGRMELRTDPGTGGAYMVFTGGVKLVYDPGTTEE